MKIAPHKLNKPSKSQLKRQRRQEQLSAKQKAETKAYIDRVFKKHGL
jgi:hypothetical protein